MRLPIFITVMLACCPGQGDVLQVDVDEWGKIGSGVTSDGWTVAGIESYSEGGVYFNAGSDVVTSPVFPGLVTQVIASVRSSSATMTRSLSLIPQEAQPWAQTNVATTTSGNEYRSQWFSWTAGEGVRQFSFRMVGPGSGNWGLNGLSVYLDRVERPVSLWVGKRYSDAFEVRWDAEPRAVRFEIAAGRVDEVLPAFTSLKEWNFSVLTNVSGNTKSFLELDPPEELQDVGGKMLNLQAKSGGHLQVGMDNVAGLMALPLPEGLRRTALMTLFRHENDKADGISSNLVVSASGVTNALPNVWLTVRPTEFRLDIPDDAANLQLCSLKARRVRVVDVRIVSDYVPGSVTTNWVVNRTVRARESVVKGLSHGRWLWRVRAFDAHGWNSSWSSFNEVMLGSDLPSYADRGFGLLLR